MPSTPIPVHILTGFLGSGKTTLLRQILANEAFGDTAVLINEFGEVGLDQVLIEEISEDVVLLNSGCLCCTLRGELRDALDNLLNKRTRGEIPPFQQIIIETTGLAKPTLILSTILAAPRIRHHFSIGSIITTVDALHSHNPSHYPLEWIEQVTAANTLVITKLDLITTEKLNSLKHELMRLNPTASITTKADLNLHTLFLKETQSTLETETPQKNTPRFIANHPAQNFPLISSDKHHDSTIQSLHIHEKTSLEWEPFGVWLSMLLHAHGDKILRVKGTINISDNPELVVIQGVQHVIYPPEHLTRSADDNQATDLVFITRHLNPNQILKSFKAFVLKEES